MDGYLSLREASELTGLQVGAIRQAARRGRIQSIKVEGVHGEETWVYKEGLQDYVQSKRTAPKQKQNLPQGARARIVLQPPSEPPAVQAELLGQLEAIRAELESNRRTIQTLSEELHDARGQIHQLHQQVIKALPAPQKEERKGFWSRFTGRNK